MKNVNSRDFDFLTFAEIYSGLYSISGGPKTVKTILLREQPTKYIMPYCHFIGGNYWILKTTHQNRGIGIYVFKSISQLIRIILKYVKFTKHDDLATTSPLSVVDKYRTKSPDQSQNKL